MDESIGVGGGGEGKTCFVWILGRLGHRLDPDVVESSPTGIGENGPACGVSNHVGRRKEGMGIRVRDLGCQFAQALRNEPPELGRNRLNLQDTLPAPEWIIHAMHESVRWPPTHHCETLRVLRQKGDHGLGGSKAGGREVGPEQGAFAAYHPGNRIQHRALAAPVRSDQQVDVRQLRVRALRKFKAGVAERTHVLQYDFLDAHGGVAGLEAEPARVLRSRPSRRQLRSPSIGRITVSASLVRRRGVGQTPRPHHHFQSRLGAGSKIQITICWGSGNWKNCT